MSGIRGTISVDPIIDDWLVEIQEDLKDDYDIDMSIREISDFTEELGIDGGTDSPADAIYDTLQEES